MNKSILLTGATGFLGSHILKNLLGINYKIIILKRSFSNTFRIENDLNNLKIYNLDEINLEKIFEENEIDIVLHTATQYGRKQESIVDIVESNLMLPLKLLSLSQVYNVKTFINTDTLLDKRISSYALSKKQFRNWLQFYSNNMTCINVSLEHFFGPKDDSTKFVTYIIKSLIEEVEKLDLTAGEQERDFIYIDDVVEAFIVIIQNINNQNGFYEYEIGSGVNIKIKDFILKTADILENTTTKLNFGALPYRENEVMKSHVNLTEIYKLGWSPKTNFVDGLYRTIKLERNV
jgi:nucleoside-diphosphate-sugar epimerase